MLSGIFPWIPPLTCPTLFHAQQEFLSKQKCIDIGRVAAVAEIKGEVVEEVILFELCEVHPQIRLRMLSLTLEAFQPLILAVIVYAQG